MRCLSLLEHINCEVETYRVVVLYLHTRANEFSQRLSEGPGWEDIPTFTEEQKEIVGDLLRKMNSDYFQELMMQGP